MSTSSSIDRKSIQISGSAYNKLKDRFEIEKGKGVAKESFGNWSSRKISQMADKEDWVESMYPDLVLSGVDEYGAMIRDTKNGILNEVKLVNKRLTCMTCDGHPKDCEHVLMVQASKRSSIISKNTS